MTKIVVTANTEDTVDDVQNLMVSKHLSSVPVVDAKGVLFGIVSAADLLRFHSMQKHPKAARAWEICTYKPIEVEPSVTVGEVANLMLTNKIHHIVVAKNHEVQGFVSAFDIVAQYVMLGGVPGNDPREIDP
jgi:signal-transduction protein with cAMP-binding, CBS, and nucleotidyltransferase domain